MKQGSMIETKLGIAVLAGVMLAGMLPSWSVAAGLDEALRDGAATLDIRPRYEGVDQNNSLKDADALTVRSRVGYGSGDFYGLTANLEMENITAIGAQDYNSGANGKTAYSVVADPTGSQVDQANLAWAASPDTRITLGRQVINLDNQRFVGRVDWRQNGQTFDALNIVNQSLPATVITYAYVSNVDRISATDARMYSNLVNVRYSGWGLGALTGYAYLLHYDQPASASTQTYGLRFNGASAAGEGGKLLYTAEFAQQSDYAGNPGSYSLDYMLFELGGAWRGVTAKLGYESLAGDGRHSVQTPLATLHTFNGWADQFLITPADGLHDAYVSAGGVVAGVNLLTVYHDFTADRGGASYGSEWDFQAVKKFNKIYSVLVEYASYHAGAAAAKVDTDKLWLMGELSL